MNSLKKVVLTLAMCALAMPAFAQSPNNAGILVVVVDQSGAVVKDAKVTIVNTATGASREGMSGAEGTVNMPALPLDGSYKISVSKPGFTADDVTGLKLRALKRPGENHEGKTQKKEKAPPSFWRRRCFAKNIVFEFCRVHHAQFLVSQVACL